MSDAIGRLNAALAGRYRVEHEIGAGGMATVYLAEDLRHHRKVAVKVLRPELAGSLGADRFVREIGIAANLSHPHILPVHDSGAADGVLYYVMPYAEGESLRDKLEREGALPIPEAARLLREVADALAKAHRAGIVHRDIKPENILIADGHALVTDFGIARAMTAAGAGGGVGPGPGRGGGGTGGGAALTSMGMAVGTPAYMSPEQAAGESEIDARADLYAFGVVAYEMLTGQAPFRGDTPQQIIAAQISARPAPIIHQRPSLPTPLAELVMRCLAKHRGDRPLSAEDMLPVLDDAATFAMRRSGDSASLGRRWPWSWGAAFAIAALGILGAGYVFVTRIHMDTDDAARSIAVLPLTNLGGDTSTAWFSDGISGEILNALTPLPGLKVIGRASSFRYRGDTVDLAAVGKALGVQSILTGTIQRNGDSLRVSAELTDAKTGRALLSRQYDGAAGQVFALEDEIAHQIADALRAQFLGVALGPLPEVRHGTTSPQAHDFVLRADAAAQRADRASLDAAIAGYRQALKLDSGYADAWAGLSLAYGQVADAWRPPVEMIPLAKAAALRAIAADDSLARGHVALGNVLSTWEWNFADAKRELRQAIELDPGSEEARMHYAIHLMWVDNDFVGAARELAVAADRDPFNPGPVARQLSLDLVRGAHGLAAGRARRLAQLTTKDTYYGHDIPAAVDAAEGNWDACLREYQRTTPPDWDDFMFGYCAARAGRADIARKVLQTIQGDAYTDQVCVAAIEAASGRMDAAFAALDKAVADRSANVPPLRVVFWAKELRGDARFAGVMARVGLPRKGPPAAVRRAP